MLKSFLKTGLFFLIWTTCATPLGAQNPSMAFSFLNRSLSPAASALGSATVSRPADLSSLFINPATLAFTRRTEWQAGYSNHLLDMSGGVSELVFPVKNGVALSLGLLYFNYGSFDEIDQFATKTGRTFSASDLALNMAIGVKLSHSTGFGLAVKYGHSRIDEFNASLLAGDLGLIYRPGFLNGGGLGISLVNGGLALEAYDQIKEELPTLLQTGLDLPLFNFPAQLFLSASLPIRQFTRLNKMQPRLSLGSEWNIGQTLFIRAGFDNFLYTTGSAMDNNLAGITAGLGYRDERFQVDYSFSNNGPLGSINQFGISFFLDRLKRKEEQTDQAVSEVQNQKVRVRENDQTITVSWRHIEGATYNLYLRSEGMDDWIKITAQPISKNRYTLRKPESMGKYFIAVTLVIDGRESGYVDEAVIELK